MSDVKTIAHMIVFHGTNIAESWEYVWGNNVLEKGVTAIAVFRNNSYLAEPNHLE